MDWCFAAISCCARDGWVLICRYESVLAGRCLILQLEYRVFMGVAIRPGQTVSRDTWRAAIDVDNV